MVLKDSISQKENVRSVSEAQLSEPLCDEIDDLLELEALPEDQLQDTCYGEEVEEEESELSDPESPLQLRLSLIHI